MSLDPRCMPVGLATLSSLISGGMPRMTRLTTLLATSIRRWRHWQRSERWTRRLTLARKRSAGNSRIATLASESTERHSTRAANPIVIAGWIQEVQGERLTAQRELARRVPSEPLNKGRAALACAGCAGRREDALEGGSGAQGRGLSGARAAARISARGATHCRRGSLGGRVYYSACRRGDLNFRWGDVHGCTTVHRIGTY
jgi:hypothetical protein